ncbi:TlpA family protein disulfide reductase [Sphingomonas quercus]|uniref:Redoxin family protein n=1 Tax=Sphingomonas quercus TaxID=2842451 RepID=A0ABS6BIH3_9SPHN|nr:redoxin family protein [Sphingomonas quercus]MBU3078108.1 redoxin family protein [Sphingomonas quercus]
MNAHILTSLVFLLAGACHAQEERQMPDPQAAAPRPDDNGYVAEDPQLAALVGRPAPAMTLRTVDGGALDLTSLYGTQPVYLKLWATYCIPCRVQMPGFEKLYENYGDRMKVVAVNAGFGDDAAKVRAFVARAGMRMPVAIDDGSLGAWLHMEATPLHLLIGRDGRITYAGHQDGAPLNAAIRKLVAEATAAGPVASARVETVPALRPGDAVPALMLRDADDRPMPLTAGAAPNGRAILFTASWCESYLAETEPANAAQCRKAREQAGAEAKKGGRDWTVVVAHLWTTPDAINRFRAGFDGPVRMGFDRDGLAFRRFGISHFPAVALITPDGRLEKIVSPAGG